MPSLQPADRGSKAVPRSRPEERWAPRSTPGLSFHICEMGLEGLPELTYAMWLECCPVSSASHCHHQQPHDIIVSDAIITIIILIVVMTS